MPEYQIERLEQSLRDLFPALDLDAAIAGEFEDMSANTPYPPKLTGTHPHLLPSSSGLGRSGSGEGADEPQLTVLYAGESDSRGLVAAHEAAKMVSTLFP